LQLRKHGNQRKFRKKMPCENGFLKLLFCHLRKKAARKYVDEINARGRIFNHV
jgi:hypothetical protein